MARGITIDLSTLILLILALLFTGIAYLKDPGLPWIGARNGFGWFPR